MNMITEFTNIKTQQNNVVLLGFIVYIDSFFVHTRYRGLMIGGVFLTDKYKVQISCKECGQSFTLKGREKKGIVHTGFKQCFCNNKTHFTIQTEKIEECRYAP
jgi:hypothetical protein